MQSKIDNAHLLPERAHENLPQEVQVASDHEDMFLKVGLLPEERRTNGSV